MFPAEYKKKLFIVNHGSWNRTAQAGPIGYRIMLATVEGDKVTKYEPFSEGFLQGRMAWGRPVDLLEMPDGSLLVSDDQAGAIYRISYQEVTHGTRGPETQLSPRDPEPRALSQCTPFDICSIAGSAPSRRMAASHMRSGRRVNTRSGSTSLSSQAEACQFLFELTRAPPRIADDQSRARRRVRLERPAQQFGRGRQIQPLGDLTAAFGIFVGEVPADEHPAALRLHGPANPHLELALGRRPADRGSRRRGPTSARAG